MGEGYTLDDAGLGEFVKTYALVQRRGGTIRLLNLTKRFTFGLLAVTKLITIFDTFDDEAEAIASFGGDKA